MNLFPRKLLASAAPLMLAACATTGPPKPPSLELPKPPADLRAVRKGYKVTLTWTPPNLTTDRETVHVLGPTLICREGGPELTQCGTPVGEAPAGRTIPGVRKSGAATYTDVLTPDRQESTASFVTYAVEVLNQDGRSAGLSNQVRVPSVRVLAPFENLAAEVTGQGVRLSWSPLSGVESNSSLHYLLRIYRRQEGNTAANKIADLDLQWCGGANAASAVESPTSDRRSESCPASYLDQTFEWEKTYFYHAAVVTLVSAARQDEAEVEGDDTPEVKVFADDVFPPAIPSGLQVAFSGPGQQRFIDLIWAPVADVDLDGYNVYRREEDASPSKVNPQPVKTPSYRDANVVSGRTYWYSISAVDVRGNESARSEEASEKVP